MAQKYNWISSKAICMLHEESLALHGGSRGMRDESLFESAMMRPQNLANYDENADIAEIAASYCYGLIKNYPFIDGDKRVAFLSVGIFLGINGYSLKVSPAEAIQAILGLASGDITEAAFAQWVRDHMEALK